MGSHHFTVTVRVELSRESGKFASREEMLEAIVDELDNVDPGQFDGLGADGESTYIVESWTTEATL
jgi:hypothetical protein